MSELDVYTHPSDHHMSWCDGTHSTDTGACLLQVAVDDGDGSGSALVSLTGIHCDHQRLRLAGDVTSVEALHELITTLTSFEEALFNGLNDVTCSAHLDRHPDPADADDDDPEVGW